MAVVVTPFVPPDFQVPASLVTPEFTLKMLSVDHTAGHQGPVGGTRYIFANRALAVRGLSKPETIVEAVQRLGQRHAGYGVQTQHYATVGEALLSTLAEVFGPAFTDRLTARGQCLSTSRD